MHKIIIGLLGIALLCSCGRDDIEPQPSPNPPVEPTVYDQTVLVYMSGENNLATSSEDYMGSDLAEMEKGSASLSDNQRLLVFIDSVGTNNKPHIVEIANGKRKVVLQCDSDFAASDPSKFRDIIEWTITNYPAKDYGLVLWGHASGWAVETDTVATVASTRAYGYDEGYDIRATRKAMNITQMAKAFEGLPHFKYIFADCCQFMCIESAYELRESADYLIGSPAEIPGAGAPYDQLMPMLFSKSATFYKDIIDCYYDYYFNIYKSSKYVDDTYFDYSYVYGYSVPLSVIDLSQVELLAQATATSLASFAPMAPTDLDLSDIAFYAAFSKIPVMYDMKAVFSKYVPSDVYLDWLAVYNRAVPYFRFSKSWETVFDTIYDEFSDLKADTDADEKYGCVSMFFPQQRYAYANYRYNTSIRNFQWYYQVNWSNYGW